MLACPHAPLSHAVAQADPSGAMGLLWVRRGLAFWAKLFSLEVERLKSTGEIDGEPGTFKKQSDTAYHAVVAPFHGVCTQRRNTRTLLITLERSCEPRHTPL